MTITLDLAPEDTERLYGIAAKNGDDAEAAARSLFKKALADAADAHDFALEGQSGPVSEWDADFRAKYNISPNMQPLTEEELKAIDPEDEGEAISVGLDASFAGRVTPLAEWSAKVRARHNLPEGAKAMSHEEAMRLP